MARCSLMSAAHHEVDVSSRLKDEHCRNHCTRRMTGAFRIEPKRSENLFASQELNLFEKLHCWDDRAFWPLRMRLKSNASSSIAIVEVYAISHSGRVGV